MPDKESKIYQEKPEQSGKLTKEEVKEMVEKFKKKQGGLLPEYFALPGEEKEEERKYSEETMLAYEIKEFLEKIRPELENEQLIKNAEEYLKSDIKFGQKWGNTVNAWDAVRGYIFFKQSDLWLKLDQKSQDWVEKTFKIPS